MTLFELFDAFETTQFANVIRESVWAIPAIQSLHLLGLASLGGAVLAMDLRLLNIAFTRQPVAAVLATTRWWLYGSIGLMIATGVPMLATAALRAYFNTSFWVKMIGLATAIVFVFVVRNPLLKSQIALGSTRTSLNVALGLTSIAIWLTVAAAGRWIGFS
jgi:hypothetical protein